MSRNIPAFLASVLTAQKHCVERKNSEWVEKHQARIEAALSHLPSGSGFDMKPSFTHDLESATPSLTFTVPFHLMGEHGYICWLDILLSVSPSFDGFEIQASCLHHKELVEEAEADAGEEEASDFDWKIIDIVDYVVEVYDEVLRTELDQEGNPVKPAQCRHYLEAPKIMGDKVAGLTVVGVCPLPQRDSNFLRVVAMSDNKAGVWTYDIEKQSYFEGSYFTVTENQGFAECRDKALKLFRSEAPNV